MSHIVASKVNIDTFLPHPNADRLKLTKVGTMQVCYGGEPTPGSYIHVLPEAFGPKATFDKLGVWQHLAHKSKDGEPWGVVRAARLRGQFSYGFLVPEDEWLQAFGAGDPMDRAQLSYYDPDIHGSARHFDPQVSFDATTEREHPLFRPYGGIENYHREPRLISDGEHVVVTEKIHGMNARYGLVRTNFQTFEVMFGSNNKRRAFGQRSLFERPFSMYPRLVDMLRRFEGNSVVMYGELFGRNADTNKPLQDLTYGRADVDFRMFDIKIDGRWATRLELADAAAFSKIPTAPILYDGPYIVDEMWKLSQGPTTIMHGDGKPHIREGVVAVADDRRQLKFINEDYLLRKDGTEEH